MAETMAVVRKCPECGKEFVPGKCYSRRRYCDRKCSHRVSNRKHYAADPEKEKERGRKWRTANPEKGNEYYRKWRAANPEKERERARKDRRRCAAVIRAYAERSGWPADLPLYCIKILNVLAVVGLPMLAVDIFKVLGEPAKKLVSWMAGAMMSRGLMIKIDGKRPCRCYRYTLGPVALTLLEERARCERDSNPPS